ncbi:MAG TPA: hypothetical protein VLM38_14065 [Blastocatellia bacterium]|nr:hypothetical protein [Blastocatellia bacterium]
MEERKNENATNHHSNPKADSLSDLAVAPEQADAAKGGAPAAHVRVFSGSDGGLVY